MAETGFLNILRGLPGSGKSTYAEYEAGEGEAVVLSRDSMRDMLYPSGHSGVLASIEEHLISETLRAMAVRLLGDGRYVIIDATNLRDKYVREWMTLAHGRGHDFEVTDFRDCPLDAALKRNAQRDRQVPEDVIRDMHQRFIKGRDLVADNIRIAEEVMAAKGTVAVEPAPEYDPYLPDAYVFDLDGTLALKHESRDIYDASKAHLDYPNEAVVEILERITEQGDVVRIFCTGRHEQDRAATERWLEKHVGFDYEDGDLLLMRQNKGRADTKEKLDLYNEHIRGQYNVLAVFDDRDSVVAMWRELGLPTMQVAPGNF